MNVIKEHDGVRLLQPVEGDDIREDGSATTIIVPAGAEGTVVSVYGPPTKPVAYLVEFVFDATDSWVLATVDAYLLCLHSMRGGLRREPTPDKDRTGPDFAGAHPGYRQ